VGFLNVKAEREGRVRGGGGGGGGLIHSISLSTGKTGKGKNSKKKKLYSRSGRRNQGGKNSRKNPSWEKKVKVS